MSNNPSRTLSMTCSTRGSLATKLFTATIPAVSFSCDAVGFVTLPPNSAEFATPPSGYTPLVSAYHRIQSGNIVRQVNLYLCFTPTQRSLQLRCHIPQFYFQSKFSYVKSFVKNAFLTKPVRVKPINTPQTSPFL